MTTKLAAHSPAPWEIAQYENWKGFSIWAPGAGCIAERWYASEHEDAPILANARLIAAAPDMLASMEETLSLVEFYAAREMNAPANNQEAVRDTREKLERFRAAIRAAVGAQEENTQ